MVAPSAHEDEGYSTSSTARHPAVGADLGQRSRFSSARGPGQRGTGHPAHQGDSGPPLEPERRRRGKHIGNDGEHGKRTHGKARRHRRTVGAERRRIPRFSAARGCSRRRKRHQGGAPGLGGALDGTHVDQARIWRGRGSTDKGGKHRAREGAGSRHAVGADQRLTLRFSSTSGRGTAWGSPGRRCSSGSRGHQRGTPGPQARC